MPRASVTMAAVAIVMQAGMVAMNTLPVSVMLPPSVGNLIVPVAVGASHVAFSAIRLEPTWMLIGAAAGTAPVLARCPPPAACGLPRPTGLDTREEKGGWRVDYQMHHPWRCHAGWRVPTRAATTVHAARAAQDEG